MELGSAPEPPSESSIQECPHCQSLIDVSGLDPLARITCPSCAGELRVSGMVGPFELLEVAGRGGMGVVYKALDTQLHRQVALKLLRKNHSDNEKLIAQLETEAAITASINHPHVVKVYSTGTCHGRFYIAMELVDKGSLDDLIQIQTQIAESQVLQIGAQIAKGLRAAQQCGLIHRDVKPGNILFASANSAKIVDFGLAIFMSEEEASRGEVWGTPYYVAPEKLESRPEDFRSDIYSLGGTLFHALAGRPPFEAESASLVALKHLKSEPVSLQSFAPNVSGRTNYIINRTLLKDPDQRYQSYDELIEHLEYAQEELLAHAGKTQTKRVIMESKESQKAWFWISAAMVAIMLFGGLGFFFFKDQILGTGNSRDSEAGARVKSNLPPALKSAQAKLLSGKAEEAANEIRQILLSGKLSPSEMLIGGLYEGLAELDAGRVPAAQIAFGKMIQTEVGRSNDPIVQQFNTFLIELASKLASDNPLASNYLRDLDSKSPQSIAYLLYGLKLCQLAKIEEGARILREFRQSEPSGAYGWIKELKPLAVHYIDDSTRLQMGAARLKVAQTREQKWEIAKDFKVLRGQMAVKAMEILKPYERELAELEANEKKALGAWNPVAIGEWMASDIGRVMAEGGVSAGPEAGAYTVRASGGDIWDAKDAFHFLYQKVSGDLEIITRVRACEKTHDFAKAGLTIRESLAPESKNIAIVACPNRKTAFQWRIDSGGGTQSELREMPIPCWVKLVRRGDSIKGFHSVDGSNWVEIPGKTAIKLPAEVYVGIALTSHVEGTVTSASFDSLKLKKGQ